MVGGPGFELARFTTSMFPLPTSPEVPGLIVQKPLCSYGSMPQRYVMAARTTNQSADAEEPLGPSTIVTVGHTHETYGDSFDVDEVSLSIEQEIADAHEPQPQTNGVTSQPVPGARQETGRPLSDLEAVLPDLVAAVKNKSVSFGQLTDAYNGKEGTAEPDKHDAYVQIYPLVRKAFQHAEGDLIDIHSSRAADLYVATTKPPLGEGITGWFKRHWPANRWQKGGFHFQYNLGTLPVAAETIIRINQLHYDAHRILNPAESEDCFRELYSAATDISGIIEEHRNMTDAATEKAKIAAVGLNLDELDRRYLQVKAQLLYFGGVIFGAASAVLGIVFISTLAGLNSVGVVAMMLAAIGATISVVQKMSDEALTIKYDVGWFAVMFRGFTRPIIGSFAALLLLLAIKAELIPVSKTGGPGAAYILLIGFAIGWAERVIPDIFSRAGLQGGLPAATGAGTSSS